MRGRNVETRWVVAYRLTVLGLWQCELLTTKFDTKMKTNYSYNEMKRAFECGRNFQLTGENNFQELIEELNQALPQADVIKSVCEHDIRNFKDRQECEKCGEVWIRQ
jgi:hypothetical protein